MQVLKPFEPYCRICGMALVESAGMQEVCGGCCTKSPPFRQCRSLFHYQPPISKLITDFKFNAGFAQGHALAVLLAQAMQQHYSNSRLPQTLVPVPLHRKRLCRRGYNQALELAKVISPICGIPVSFGDIIRIRDSPPQTSLSALARKENVRNVFSISAANCFNGVTFVAVIDDVMTTMSTASALSKMLTLQGVEIVDVWTLARVSQEAMLVRIENQKLIPHSKLNNQTIL